MQVLHVCSEMFPLLKTGGLADVVGALPAAQIAEGGDVRVLLPAFPDVRNGIPDSVLVAEIDSFAGRVGLRYGTYHGVGIYLIDVALACTSGRVARITTNHLNAYADNHPTLCPAGLDGLRAGARGWIGTGARRLCMPTTGMRGWPRAYLRRANGHPATFHLHRAQPGVSGAVLAGTTWHELWFPRFVLQRATAWSSTARCPILKAGLYYADHVTAVSPTYAQRDHPAGVWLRYGGAAATETPGIRGA
jgi:starch synthase